MIFSVVSTEVSPPPGLPLRMKHLAKSLQIFDMYEPRVWYVAFSGTSAELSEKIGFGDDDSVGSGVVTGIASYYGFASGKLWEWLRIHG